MRTTFHSHLGLLSVLIAPNLVLAQTSDVDNISNWPACAVSSSLAAIIMTRMLTNKQQKCIPLGYGPPANCGSLSNLDCICDNPEFTLAIADCEQSSCLLSERAGKFQSLKRRRSEGRYDQAATSYTFNQY